MWGGVYRIETVLLSARDPKARRPAVVIALCPPGLPDVTVVTRTSDTSAAGVAHPASPGLSLSKPGVFAYKFQRTIDVKFFKLTQEVVYLGQLEQPFFDELLRWWRDE